MSERKDGDASAGGSGEPPAGSGATFDAGQTVLDILGVKLGGALRLSLRADEGDPTPAETHHVGTIVPQGRGHYRLLGEIARGGMGVVLRGRDDDLGRDVAVKVLHEDVAKNDAMLQRFVEEAQIGGQLQHPGIVPVYELGLMADQRPYFTMKLVKGRTLESLLEERLDPTTDRRRFLAIFEAVCQTMGYAHSRGVIHRDLKPANVMVGAFGEVQLVDWGLAKVLHESGDSERKRPAPANVSVIETVRSGSGSTVSESVAGAVMGTLPYMSPEQARGEVEGLDERTDVFLLGGILCEILTGKAPYPGLRKTMLARAALPEQSEVLDRLARCEADPELIELATTCMAAEPKDRPEDAGAVAECVHTYLAGLEERARTAQIEAAEQRGKAAEERRARRLTVWLAASVVLTLVVGGGAWGWMERDRSLRRIDTEERVASALSEGILARGRGSFDEARSAVERARAHLLAGVGDALLEERIGEEEQKLVAAVSADREARERASRRASFLVEVDAVRGLVGRDTEVQVEAYRRAFESQGIVVESMSNAEVVTAVRASGMPVEMALALVDWGRILWYRAREVTDEARRLIELAIAVDEDEVRTALRRSLLAGEEEAILAIASGERSVEFSPVTAIVVADALWWLGNPEAAIDLLKRTELRHPGDFPLQSKLASRYMGNQDWETALPYLKAAVALEPRNARVLANLGIALRRLGDLEGAIQRGRRAVEVDPENAFAHHHLGVSLREDGQDDAAIASYRRSVELDPEYSYGRARLGYALWDRKLYTEAIESFRRAVEFQPDSRVMQGDLAWALATVPDASLRDPGGAVEHAELAAAIRRDSFRMRILGTAYYRAGRFDESAAALEEAIGLSDEGGRPEAFFFLAMAQGRRGEEEVARVWYEKGLAWMGSHELDEEEADELPRFRDEAAQVLSIDVEGGD